MTRASGSDGRSHGQRSRKRVGLYDLYRRQTAPRQNNLASGLLLRSVCTIFSEDRRHLGKTTPQAGCFCARFVLSLQKKDGTSAKQPRERGCFCPRFILSLYEISHALESPILQGLNPAPTRSRCPLRPSVAHHRRRRVGQDARADHLQYLSMTYSSQ